MAQEPKYLSAEEARAQWSKTHGLPVDMAPKFPEGTREYSEYRKGISRRIGGVRARWLIENSTTAALFSSGIPLPYRA